MCISISASSLATIKQLAIASSLAIRLSTTGDSTGNGKLKRFLGNQIRFKTRNSRDAGFLNFIKEFAAKQEIFQEFFAFCFFSENLIAWENQAFALDLFCNLKIKNTMKGGTAWR